MDTKKNIVICDIDGTVENNDRRQHRLNNKKSLLLIYQKISKLLCNDP